MDLYSLLVLVHIAAGVSLLSGSVIASPAVRTAVQRARTVQEVRAYLAIGRPLLFLEPVSAMVVLASGVYLTSVAHFWSQAWVQVAAGCWVVNAVVAAALVKPAIGRVASLTGTLSDGPVGQPLDTLRRSPRWSFGGDVLMANDAAMLFVMTIKPGLADALLVVAVANTVVAAARTLGRFQVRAAAGVASEGPTP